VPSDLEDDVLMAFLKLSRKVESMKKRDALINVVWGDVDRLVRALQKDPVLAKALERELLQLQGSVVRVLDFDAEHAGGADAGVGDDASG
jgi:hypothetical protein